MWQHSNVAWGPASYHFLEAESVFFVARETVDEELVLPTAIHGLLKQLHCHLCRHNLTLLDHALDHVPVVRPRVDLLTQKVSSAQVHESKLVHNLCALRPFPTARSA